MTKIHFDTDLGSDIDDLCALALLLRRPGAELTGITTVTEDQGRRAGYVKYVLGVAGEEHIPVAAGADVSSYRYRFRPDFLKESDYWPQPIAPFPTPLGEALDLLRQSILQKAIIVAVGPYTNLRLLDTKYPGILCNAVIYLSGGWIYPPRKGFPQWDRRMDYNTQMDVRSATHVLLKSAPTLVPISVTIETSLRGGVVGRLSQSGALGKLIARQAEAFARDKNYEERYGRACEGLPEDFINFQHDSLACAMALGWNAGVEIRTVPLKLELRRGWLHEVVHEGGKTAQTVTKIDADEFNSLWVDTVSSPASSG